MLLIVSMLMQQPLWPTVTLIKWSTMHLYLNDWIMPPSQWVLLYANIVLHSVAFNQWATCKFLEHDIWIFALGLLHIGTLPFLSQSCLISYCLVSIILGWFKVLSFCYGIFSTGLTSLILYISFSVCLDFTIPFYFCPL